MKHVKKERSPGLFFPKQVIIIIILYNCQQQLQNEDESSKRSLMTLKTTTIMYSSIKTKEDTNAPRGATCPREFLWRQKNTKIPASNSNSAPSALVSLWRPPPLSNPSPSSCSWQAFVCNFTGWVGLCKLTPLKAGVTTMNFIHCLAKATRPFFKVTKAGRPSLFKKKKKN